MPFPKLVFACLASAALLLPAHEASARSCREEERNAAEAEKREIEVFHELQTMQTSPIREINAKNKELQELHVWGLFLRHYLKSCRKQAAQQGWR